MCTYTQVLHMKYEVYEDEEKDEEEPEITTEDDYLILLKKVSVSFSHHL